MHANNLQHLQSSVTIVTIMHNQMQHLQISKKKKKLQTSNKRKPQTKQLIKLLKKQIKNHFPYEKQLKTIKQANKKSSIWLMKKKKHSPNLQIIRTQLIKPS